MISADFCPWHDIKRVILDPEVYDRISDDYSPAREDFRLPVNLNAHYIGGYVNGEIASLFIVHGDKMHFMVLRKFRGYAKHLLRRSFDLWPHDVWCEIPSLYEDVIRFAKKFGFREVRVKKSTHKKGGEVHDCHILRYEHGIC